MKLRQLAEDSLFVANSTLIVLIVSCLVWGEGITLSEPTPWIKVTEFSFFLAVLGYQWISHLRGRRKEGK